MYSANNEIHFVDFEDFVVFVVRGTARRNVERHGQTENESHKGWTTRGCPQ